MKENNYSLGIDIGSTTAKLVLMCGDDIVYQKYQRHRSKVRATTLEMLREMQKECDIKDVKVTISGSAGMGMAETAGIDFIQEVYATGEVVYKLAPDTGVVIELGGEDAKVIFYKGGVDQRMNGS
ncbi:MAG: 2-hydroxyglutaryl-CoA dehydratase, partial [Clostridia bacterium]|nr:2-hydroxyglutaryl-CoA dehydratase [Clostridia bacterium]